MTIRVAGFPKLPTKLPTTLIPYDNFSDAVIDNIRTLTFSEGGTPQNTTFLLDGKEFNPEVIDQIMTLGTTEEWHIVNQSSEIHPFHIHVNPFQVVSVNGQPIVRKGMDDTYPIPANGEIVIRTKYRDFDGKYVLHCHILFHEDHGMMQLVEVMKPGATSAPDNGLPEREGMLHLLQMPH
jgi:FtsP/CotA-like multicopper oxidase with cupredoxin domain